jgi:hypothetical protein
MLRSIVLAILLSFFAAGNLSAADTKANSDQGKKEQSAKVMKKTDEANPIQILKAKTSSIGTCGGCLSNPQFCCSAGYRPVCDGSSCYCWADSACQ